MNYIVRELLYLAINFKHKISNKKLKMEFGAKASLHSDFEGYNKISRGAYFSGTLGYGSYIGEHSIVEGKVGKYCSIAGNVIFLTKTHPTDWVSTHPCFYSMKKQSGFTYAKEQLFDENPKLRDSKYAIEVGNDVYIGYGVTIIGPVKIGNGAIIAANSTVTHDVAEYSIVAGTPAKLVKMRYTQEEIDFLTSLKWWYKDEAWFCRYAPYFKSVQELKKKIETDMSDSEKGSERCKKLL